MESLVSKIFEAQKSNRWVLAAGDVTFRRGRLSALKKSIENHREDIIAALKSDFSKPSMETELTELFPVLEEIGFAIKHLKKWMTPHRVRSSLVLAGATSEIRYEPKGMVLVMAPWNYPFQLAMSPLVAAVAAGNCVILRPSSKCPRTAQIMTQILGEVFPSNEVAVVDGGKEVADQLLELPFDHLFFTGSTNIGKKVMAAAARHLGSVTLELGGKSPAIVDRSANIEKAAERIVWGRFINSGQTCVAPDYAFVHESKVGEFLSAAKSVVEKFYGIGPEARKQSADFARIIDDSSFKRLSGALLGSVQAGAKVETGGDADAETRYVSPTILSGVNENMPIMREEIFGPILPVMTFKTAEEVSAFIQRHDKPLALYLFTQDSSFESHILKHTSAGGTVVNNVLLQMGNPHLPFGGIGASGQGNYHGFFGFRTLSHERAVVHQHRLSFAHYFFPPYSGWLKAWASKILKRLT